MRNKATEFFRIVAKNQYYRLVHVPSQDYIQRHLCDFLTRRDAAECRDAIIAAVPDWDWSNPTLFAEMGKAEFEKAWAAIYSSQGAA